MYGSEPQGHPRDGHFIKEHMLTKNEGATKDDVRSIIQQLVPEIVAVELGPVHQQLREINQRLDVLDIAADAWCCSV
jgi:DUF438 domain-containing protein